MGVPKKRWAQRIFPNSLLGNRHRSACRQPFFARDDPLPDLPHLAAVIDMSYQGSPTRTCDVQTARSLFGRKPPARGRAYQSAMSRAHRRLVSYATTKTLSSEKRHVSGEYRFSTHILIEKLIKNRNCVILCCQRNPTEVITPPCKFVSSISCANLSIKNSNDSLSSTSNKEKFFHI